MWGQPPRLSAGRSPAKEVHACPPQTSTLAKLAPAHTSAYKETHTTPHRTGRRHARTGTDPSGLNAFCAHARHKIGPAEFRQDHILLKTAYRQFPWTSILKQRGGKNGKKRARSY